MIPSPRTDLRSQSLDLLRFPLALFVVAVHVFSPFPYIDTADMPVTDAIFRFVAAFIKDQSVPVYFFIAGYVFFLGVDMSIDAYAGKLRRRCNSLLMPYLVWNTVAILYMLKVFLPGISSVSEFAGSGGLDLSLSAFIESFRDDRFGIAPYDTGYTDGTFPIDKPLWFVRDLMIMALISPAIYTLYRLPSRTATSVLAAATLVWTAHIPGLGHLAQLLEAFVFFAWGGFMSYHRRDMMLEFKRCFVTSMILYPLLATAVMILSPHRPEAMMYVKSINIIVGLFFFYNLSAWLVSHKHLKASPFLASASFFIYCGHFIILDPIARRVFGIISPQTDLAAATAYIIIYVLIIGILLVTYALMRRFTPRLLAPFTGGRV